MNPPELCPFCHNTSVTSGRYFLGDVYGPPLFEPEDLQLPKWEKGFRMDMYAKLADTAKACVHCGRLWGDLDVDQLRQVFRKYGTDESKSRLSFDLER